MHKNRSTLKFSAFCTPLKSILINCESTLKSFCSRNMQTYISYEAKLPKHLTFSRTELFLIVKKLFKFF